ncbi:MAG: DUF1622 domain-containing protein [Enterococcus sp.]
MENLSHQLMDAVIPYLDLIIFILNIFSILVLVWGVFLSAKDFIKSELSKQTRLDVAETNTTIKNFLGSYVLLSLEILIAADIIESIINPTLTDILRLAALVVIRTIISYFLHREIEDAQQGEKQKEPET